MARRWSAIFAATLTVPCWAGGEIQESNRADGASSERAVAARPATEAPVANPAASTMPIEPIEPIEEVIVTASRIGRVDQNLTVWDERELALPTLHAADRLRELPGLAVAGGSRGSLTQARLRGAEANHLLVLVDGVPVNDLATGGAFNFGMLDLTGLRRLELLSGPQSAVWGSTALAGVLHLLTTPAPAGNRLALTGGSHGTARADATLSRAAGPARVALSLGRVASDGTNTALRGDERDGFANTTAHLRTSVANRGWVFSSTARWTDAEAEYDPTPPPRFAPQDGDRRSDSRALLLLGRARYAGFERFEPWVEVATLRTRLADVADGATTGTFAGRRDTATFAGNWRHGRQGFNLTAEAKSERFAQTGTPTFYGDPNQRQHTRTFGIAAEYQAQLERAAFSASVRRDFNTAFRHATTYRLGVTSTGNPRWFANIGRGVKNPTFVERFGYTPDTFHGNPDLLPESARGVEAGVILAGRRGDVSLTAFESRLRDEIDGFVFDSASGAFTARNRLGKSRRSGAELAFNAQFGRVRLRANTSLTRARDDEGQVETRRPRHLAAVSARLRLTGRAEIGVGVSHAGAAEDQDFSTYPARRVRLPGYRLLRADANFALADDWRLRLMVDNALDAPHSAVFGYRGPGRSALVRVETTW